MNPPQVPGPSAGGGDPALASFVLPTLNEAETLGLALRSIEEQRLPEGIESTEIVVVDNGSTDTTLAIAERHGAKILVEPPSTVSRSRNLGARASRGTWLAFVDADCELDPGWLERSVEHLRRGNVVATGTNVAPPLPDAPWVEKAWFLVGYKRTDRPWLEVEWLPTFNLLVERAAFEAIGGFEESLAACEDSDLSYRLLDQGRLVMENELTTRHHRESKTLRQLFRRESWRGSGNFRAWLHHGFRWSELPSLLFPAAFVGGLALTAGLLLVAADPRLWLLTAAVTALVPLALPIAKGVHTRAPAWLLPCYLVSAVYFLARGLALALPFRRR